MASSPVQASSFGLMRRGESSSRLSTRRTCRPAGHPRRRPAACSSCGPCAAPVSRVGRRVSWCWGWRVSPHGAGRRRSAGRRAGPRTCRWRSSRFTSVTTILPRYWPGPLNRLRDSSVFRWRPASRPRLMVTKRLPADGLGADHTGPEVLGCRNPHPGRLTDGRRRPPGRWPAPPAGSAPGRPGGWPGRSGPCPWTARRPSPRRLLAQRQPVEFGVHARSCSSSARPRRSVSPSGRSAGRPRPTASWVLSSSSLYCVSSRSRSLVIRSVVLA
jgi:hypothetical protein